MTYKQGRLLKIVLEIDRVGNKYNINGIDESQAIFFWRTNQEMYDTIPKGSYTVTNESNGKFLNINDTTVNYEKIQICYEFASISSGYEVDFNVDINILKDRYNDLVEDVKNIYSYVKSNMMLADGKDVAMVLPQLDKDEVWVSTGEGWRGFNVGSVEENLNSFLEILNETYEKIIEEINKKGISESERVEKQGDTQVEKINSTTTQIDKKLDVMWRMYSITTGANRYLSGNNIENRDNTKLEREVIAGNVSDRIENPRRIYTGGKIVDRIITLKEATGSGNK